MESYLICIGSMDLFRLPERNFKRNMPLMIGITKGTESRILYFGTIMGKVRKRLRKKCGIMAMCQI